MAAEKPQRVVQISPDAHAAQEIAEGLDAFEQAGVGRLNNKTVPGGYFIGTDGEPHDAHGRKIGNGKAAKMSGEEAAARLAELNAEREELQARVQQAQVEEHVNAEINNAAAAEDADDAPKKKARR